MMPTSSRHRHRQVLLDLTDERRTEDVEWIPHRRRAYSERRRGGGGSGGGGRRRRRCRWGGVGGEGIEWVVRGHDEKERETGTCHGAV